MTRPHGAHHFFVAPSDIDEHALTITGDEAHHAARVLRVRAGESITAADDTGRVVHAVVVDVGDVIRADVVKETFVDEPRPRVVLFQALPKGDKLDEVVQKATEVGVARIVPFVGARSVVRWDERKRMKAPERWCAVARAAAKQSRSPRLLVVDAVADHLRSALDEPVPVLVLHEGDRAAPLRHVLPADAPETLTIAVGPEGGFDDAEIDELARGGAEIVRLGPRVLRTETAGVVAASIIAYVYGDLG
jgi:16S rRNA (uracil1498-N3)-methyltransferase